MPIDWKRFKEEKPQEGLFIYTDGNKFYLGHIDPPWHGSEVKMNGHPHIQDIFELHNSEEIKYWSEIDLMGFIVLTREDCIVEGEPAPSEISKDQDFCDQVLELGQRSKANWADMPQYKRHVKEE